MFKTNYRYPLKYLTLILWMLGRGDMEVITFFFLETQKKNTKDYKNNKNYQVYVKSKEKKISMYFREVIDGFAIRFATIQVFIWLFLILFF